MSGENQNWARRGPPSDDEGYGPDGDSGSSGPRKPLRIVTEVQETKRVLFLDSAWFRFWEHNLFRLINRAIRVVCLRELNERGCPVCDIDSKDGRAATVGYFSVIDMGSVKEDSKGIYLAPNEWKGKKYQFDKKLLGARNGSKEMPGMLREIKRQAMKRGGDLTGTVWDLYRSGTLKESIGDKIDFVERVEKEKWIQYLVKNGAEAKNLDFKPFDYSEIFQPMSYEDLDRLVNGRSSGGGSSQRGSEREEPGRKEPREESRGKGARSEGARYEGEMPSDEEPRPGFETKVSGYVDEPEENFER